MRHALIALALAAALTGCGDDDGTTPTRRDAGEAPEPGGGSQLDRPDTLPRPPARGLPDDLRPPR